MVQGAVVTSMYDDDDIPELTPDQLAEMKPAREVMSAGAFRALKRGRPPVANPKRAVSLRIDPDVLEAYKATGKGWQSRINEVLRRGMPQ
jgi:uncharacterized protein (DUF4415 family)